MKYAVIFPGLLVVVWANLAKSHLTGVPEDETGARKESSEHPWDFVMPRPFYLTSPPNQEERPAVVKVPVDANVYYSAGIYNVHEISQSNLVAHPNSETPTFIPYIGARALSNLHEFFKHVKENLVALRIHEFLKTEGIKGFRTRHRQEAKETRNESKNDARITTRDENTDSKVSPKPLQSFSSLLEFTKDYYDPAWKGTNLGLGRRKRIGGEGNI